MDVGVAIDREATRRVSIMAGAVRAYWRSDERRAIEQSNSNE